MQNLNDRNFSTFRNRNFFHRIIKQGNFISVSLMQSKNQLRKKQIGIYIETNKRHNFVFNYVLENSVFVVAIVLIYVSI